MGSWLYCDREYLSLQNTGKNRNNMWLFKLKDKYILLIFGLPFILEAIPGMDYVLLLEFMLFFYSLLVTCKFLVGDDNRNSVAFRVMLVSALVFGGMILVELLIGYLFSTENFFEWIRVIGSLMPVIAWIIFIYATAWFVRNRKPGVADFLEFTLMLLIFPFGIWYLKRLLPIHEHRSDLG